MKRTHLSIALAALILLAQPAAASCYADYKAKQDNPLKLHYGVIEIPDRACETVETATTVVERRLARNGWTLLNVLSVFDEDGLEERKESAGPFYLVF